MLLVKQYFDRDGSGYVTLRPQEDEDMWHAYNLIQEVSRDEAVSVQLLTLHWIQGDELRASAVRSACAPTLREPQRGTDFSRAQSSRH